MGRELSRFLGAVACLTRVPIPAGTPFPADWLPRSAKFFPLVGLGVGAVAATTLWAASAVWSGPVPALLAVAAALLLTGALHEDGLADTADSAGGRSPAERLAILKDSRLGTFGVLALVGGLALRVSALAALPPLPAATAWLPAASGARLAAFLLIAVQPYAGDPARAKLPQGDGRPRGHEIALAALFGLAPLALLPPGVAAAGLGGGAVLAGWVGWRACRALGGQTGDVLGAVASVFETGFLLGVAAAWGRT